MIDSLDFKAISGLPEVREGDDLAALLADRLAESNTSVATGDLIVLAQKIVSKAEGRSMDLAIVEPSNEAIDLAKVVNKDPRLVELILRESVRVIRAVPGVVVVEDRRGLVMANAGIDRSNVPQQDGERVLLLPKDPDRSADAIRTGLKERLGVALGVIISDSFGRAWRHGVVAVAIGAAGLPSLIDRRGDLDREGRVLGVTDVAFADAISAAAGLVMGEGSEGIPAVLVKGAGLEAPEASARSLLRDPEQDLFR